jgi:hypothetical protein
LTSFKDFNGNWLPETATIIAGVSSEDQSRANGFEFLDVEDGIIGQPLSIALTKVLLLDKGIDKGEEGPELRILCLHNYYVFEADQKAHRMVRNDFLIDDE